MLSVEIYINNRLIGKETAVRIRGGSEPDSMNTYKLSDDCLLTHCYGDGAAILAEKMMRHLHIEKGS